MPRSRPGPHPGPCSLPQKETATRILAFMGAFLLPVTLHSQEHTTIAGTIVDSVSRQPIPQVTVYLMSGSRAVTDAGGRFRLTGVPREDGVLGLRRIGFVPRGIPLGDLAAGAEVQIGTLTMTPTAVALDSISVRARLIEQNPRMAAFYDRRRNGLGRYFTQNQIWGQNPLFLTEVIQTVPGVRCGVGSCSARVATLVGSCRMQVYLDGMRADNFDLSSIPPSWIAGLEVYKGPATTPLEFGMPVGARVRGPGQSGPGCGTILIWTGIDDR